MTDPIAVADIPGASPAQASAMAAVGVHLSSDLLRSDRQALVRAVAGISLEGVRAWQGFARLLECAGTTPGIVQALLAADINTPAEVAGARLSRLTAALAGVVPALDPDATVRLMLGARTLDLTGVVNGTVVTSGGRVLARATVNGGGKTGVSDPRGRFRLTGLPLGMTLTLTMSHPDKREKTFPGVKAYPFAALIGRSFRLTGRSAPALRLSALAGDVLPAPGTAPITTEVQTGAPPAGDVLRLVSLDGNGDERVASMFLDFAQGRFIVRLYRLPMAALPAGIVLKDWLEPDSRGIWTKARASRRRFRRMQRLAAVKRAHAGPPPGRPIMDAAVAKVLAAAPDPKGRQAHVGRSHISCLGRQLPDLPCA